MHKFITKCNKGCLNKGFLDHGRAFAYSPKPLYRVIDLHYKREMRLLCYSLGNINSKGRVLISRKYKKEFNAIASTKSLIRSLIYETLSPIPNTESLI